MVYPDQPPPYRYVTTTNIRAGDVILEEEAWMWSFLHLGGAKSVCSYCFKAPSKLLSCSACKSAFYCDTTCQRNDWRLRHKHDECKNLKTIRQLAEKTPGAVWEDSEEIQFNFLIPHLLLSTASARLYDAKEHDEDGNPTTPLWKTFMQTLYKADLVDLPRNPQTLTIYVCRSVKHKDTAELAIQKRVLPSLVMLSNPEPWRKALKGVPYIEKSLRIPPDLALGACLEMSKFPHTCDRPNAVTVNEGRTVRMIAMEDIENLEQVRLTRWTVWLDEFRMARRSWNLYEAFGYGCFCSRCEAGDMAAETTLFGLRCPQWAKNYAHTNKKQACNGVVKGLRRTDFSDFDVSEMTADPTDIDEPRPLPSCIAHAPPHVRAVCVQCNAKYDADTMRTKILPLLKFMEMLRLCNTAHASYFVVTVEMCDAVMQAEQYVYPTNCLYLFAKRMLMTNVIMEGIDFEHSKSSTPAGVALWLKNYVREVLARVEAVGCKQIDLHCLQEIVCDYGYYAKYARHVQHSVEIDAETRELLVTTAKRATEKLKLLLQLHKIN